MNYDREGEHEECRWRVSQRIILSIDGRAAWVVAFATLFLVSIAGSARAQRLSALAAPPDWTELERFQETITAEEFNRLLNEVYAPRNAAAGLIEVAPDGATVHTTIAPPTLWKLRFANDSASARPVPRFWRSAAELGPPPADRVLAGLRIALDPGHLGGDWARIEERWFRIGESKPVTEGDMTLVVARHVAAGARSLGAELFFVRDAPGPTTQARPHLLREVARAELAAQGNVNPPEMYAGADDPNRGSTVQFQSELLFYRAAEIRHRGDVVNRQIKPDLTICLHFNAEAWGDPRQPDFVPRNHLHTLVNGSYSAAELRNDDVRFEMLNKLLERGFTEELAVSEQIASALAEATGLPAYQYLTPSVLHVGQTPYVWARNLLANRVYRMPVAYLEPYVMNHRDVWERIQAGDYEGEREVGGNRRKSIYREYADAVVEGLRRYFQAARQP